MAGFKIEKIKLDDIVIDEAVHPRSEVNEDTIDEYAAELKNKVKFPPLVVFRDPKDKKTRLADGHHRAFAYMRQGVKVTECEVHIGDRAACIKFALGANTIHGLRRTNADKHKAVEIALAEFPNLSDRAIAELCKVSHPFVGELRAKFKPQLVTVTSSQEEKANESEVSEVPPQPKRVGLDGKEREVASDVPPRPKKEKPPEVIKDETGLAVPPETLTLWTEGEETGWRILSLVSEVKNLVSNAAKVNNPLYRECDHIDITAKLESVYTSLKVIKPYSVCFKCSGINFDKCEECHGRGFISKFYFDTHISKQRKDLRFKVLKKKGGVGK